LDNIKSLLKDDPSWVFRKDEQDMFGERSSEVQEERAGIAARS
jgi:hypothetical protein